MKTTLRIDDTVMARLKREAARRGVTMSEIVESSLRTALWSRPGDQPPLPTLPTFDCGVPLVDAADRQALYEIVRRDRLSPD
ncbi:MAG: ribbon-helix-helix protein, CopG family [Alphaproteobacteria bacterium]|nr:ribbon-helix-helix protein, CopG family [Alphaproteobacteria bacterium]